MKTTLGTSIRKSVDTKHRNRGSLKSIHISQALIGVISVFVVVIGWGSGAISADVKSGWEFNQKSSAVARDYGDSESRSVTDGQNIAAQTNDLKLRQRLSTNSNKPRESGCII